MKAINLHTMKELNFGAVSHEYAVAYGYCMENKKLSWLFDKVETGCESWKKTLPITYGQHSVGCGNWAVMLDQ